VFAGNMQAGAMKPQHSAGAIIKITIGKNGDLQQLFHTRFSKNLDFIGVSAGLNRRKTPVSALRPPTALRPKSPAAPCELAVYVNHCQDFCNTVKPKKKGSTLRSGLPMGTRSTENVYHVCRITKSHYNMEPVAM
jgi:hypothetical protein